MRNRRLSPLLLSGALLFSAFAPTVRPAAAQEVDIAEDFSGDTAPGWDISGDAYLTAGTAAIDTAGSGWLRLTDDATSQIGGAVYSEAVAADLGLEVQFTFAMHSGTSPGDTGDGFSFFLIDGSVADPEFGAGLGYSIGGSSPGISQGYLGIGFDVYGGIVLEAVGPCLTTCEASVVRNTVGVRGSGDGTDGYLLLDHVATPTLTGAPELESSGRDASRTARITLTPDLFLTVQIDFGSGFVTVIDNLDVGNAPGQAALPETFKLGVVGATGAATNVHEISDLTVVSLIERPVEQPVEEPTDEAGLCELMPDMEVRPQFITLDAGGAATVEVGVRNLCKDLPTREFDVLTSFSDWLTPVAGSDGVVLREHSAVNTLTLNPGETRFWSVTVSAPAQLGSDPVHITELYWSGRGADRRVDGVFLASEPTAAPESVAAPVAPEAVAVPVAPEAVAAPEAAAVPTTLPNTSGSVQISWLLLSLAAALMTASRLIHRRVM